MALFLLMALVCILLMMGAGAAVATTVLVVAGVLVAAGILSVSLLVAIMRRSLGAGIRMAILLGGAVAGGLIGIPMLWLTTQIFDYSPGLKEIVLLGLLAGTMGGIALAIMINYTLGLLYRLLQRRSAPRGFEVRLNKTEAPCTNNSSNPEKSPGE